MSRRNRQSRLGSGRTDRKRKARNRLAWPNTFFSGALLPERERWLSIEPLEERRMLSGVTITVNTANDTHAVSGTDHDSNGNVSLRSAIEYLNANPNLSGATISFDPSIGGTIDLTQGQIEIAESIAIDGPGAGSLTIDQTTSGSRLFQVDANDTANNPVTASISGLTLTGGSGPTGAHGAAVYNAGNLTLANSTVANNSISLGEGGGVYNDGGDLTVTASTFSNNSAGHGGAIYNASGTVAVIGSTISGNSAAPGLGGGIYSAAGSLTVTGSTLSQNQAHDGGGGIETKGTATLVDSTLSNNSTGEGAGGGIDSAGNLSVTGSTISGNTAVGDGGGINASGTVTVVNSTISGNSAASGFSDASGGGIFSSGSLTVIAGTISQNSAHYSGGGIDNVGTASLANTIVANNTFTITSDPDAAGSFTTTHDLIGLVGDASGFTQNGTATNDNIVGTTTAVNPLLGALANNGGPTQTMALLAGSPAIGAAGALASLADNLNATDVTSTVPVDDSEYLAVGEALSIDQEIVVVTAVDANTNTITISRGQDGTVEASHASGAPIYQALDQRGFVRQTQDMGAVEGPQASLMINTLADTHVDGYLTLREAVEQANAEPVAGGVTITFDPSLFASGPATIALTQGQIEIAASMDIEGPSAGSLTVDQTTAGGARVIQVAASDNTGGLVTASISGLTVTGGNVPYDDGGGILNDGNLSLQNVTVSGNSTTGGVGGGIMNDAGTLAVADCTIADNTTVYGGGVYVSAGTATIVASTITGNTADAAGTGVAQLSSGSVHVADTIIAANLSIGGNFPDVSGVFTADHDLIGVVDGATGFTDINGAAIEGNLVGTGTDPLDPLLGSLADNGGPTPTVALLAGSPAIGAAGALAFLADNLNATDTASTVPRVDIKYLAVGEALSIDQEIVLVTAVNANTNTILISRAQDGTVEASHVSGAPLYLALDQRGFVRQTQDTGAVEGPQASLMVNTLADTHVDGYLTLREAVEQANAEPVAGGVTITFAPSLVAAGPATIDLLSSEPGLSSEVLGPTALPITGDVTIIGPSGNNGLTIERGPNASAFRLFDVYAGAGAASPAALTLENLTLTGGSAIGGAGGAGFHGGGGGAGLGGAVLIDGGQFTATGCTFVNNRAVGGAGGAGVSSTVSSSGSGSSSSSVGGGGGGGGGLAGAGGNARGTIGGNGGGLFGGAGGASHVAGGNGLFGGGGGGGGGGKSGGGGGGGFGGGAGAGGFGGGGGTAGFGGGGAGNGRREPGFGGGAGGRALYAGGGGGAGLGGALFSNGGALTLTDDTLAENGASGGAGGHSVSRKSKGQPGEGLGGAVFTRNGTLTITNSTLDANAADQGGAVFAVSDSSSGDGYTGGNAIVAIANSILAGTANGATDFHSASLGTGTNSFIGTSNLIQSNAAGGNGFIAGGIISTADPKLAPLADNGGPTETMALLAGSPAIDAGENTPQNLPSSPFTAPPATDQRGFTRIVNGTIDLGAVEVQPTLYVATSYYDQTTHMTTSNPGTGDKVNWLASGQFAEVDNLIFDVNAFKSIQAAVTAATSDNTIEVAAGTYSETVVITQPLTLEGADVGVTTTIQAPTPGSGTGMTIDAGNGAVEVDGLTVTGFSTGVSVTSGVASLAHDVVSQNTNSGIYNQSTLTVNDSTISDNSALRGGGIKNEQGTLTVNHSTLSGNHTGQSGAGILNDGGTLTVSDSTLSGNNAAGGGGGGIANLSGETTVIDSTLSENSAFGGGGIFVVSGTFALSDSTLSGNSAAYDNGGGIYFNSGTLTVSDSTLSGNSAANDNGGGIYFFSGTLTVSDSTLFDNYAGGSGGGIDNEGGTVVLANTIVAGSGGGEPDVTGDFQTTDHDLIGDVGNATGFTDGSGVAINGNTVGTDASPIDPKLGPLQDNGGPTQTMALLPGSPAIAAGDIAPAQPFPAPPDTDQRGAPRIVNGAIDVGAYQSNNFYVATIFLDPNTSLITTAPSIGQTVDWRASGQFSEADNLTFGTNAFTSIQAAVDAAPAGAAIYVAAGTYDESVTIQQPIELEGADQGVTTTIQGTANSGTGVTFSNGSLANNLSGPSLNTMILQGFTVTGFATGVRVDQGDAILSQDTLTNNRGLSGLYNNASLTVRDSTIADNVAGYGSNGAGIFNDTAGALTLIDSTVSGNSAGFSGGGIYNLGAATVIDSTIANNATGAGFAGGGISNDTGGTLIVSGGTISGNTAGMGGGIANDGTASIANTVVAGNQATSGGSDPDDPDVLGSFAGTDHDLIGVVGDSSGFTDGAGAAINGNLVGTAARPLDARLAPLGTYGGPTETMALLPGSPAINAGDNAPPAPFAVTSTDQRGFARIIKAAVDIGAFETNNIYVATSFIETSTGQSTATPANGDTVDWPASGQFPEVDKLTYGIDAFTSIQAAVSAVPPGASIFIAGGTYSETVSVSQPLALFGAGPSLTTLEAPIAGSGTGITINASGPVGVNGLTVTGFSSGIEVDTTATLQADTITNNVGGGGIQNFATLTLNASTVSDNSSTFDGGGIDNVGILTVTDSTFVGNSATYGGAIENDNGVGVLTVTDSTFFDNSATASGGAIALGDPNFIHIILFGAPVACSLTISDSTLSGNAAQQSGGGIYIVSGTTSLANSIVAANEVTGGVSDPDVSGNFTTTDHDLIGEVGDASGFNDGNGNAINGNLVGSDTSPIYPFLAPLGNYGGPTETMIPLAKSPALNAGDPVPAAPFTTPSTDQRGLPREIGFTTDIGATQHQVDAVTDPGDSPGDNGATLRNVVAAANPGDVVVFTLAGAATQITLTQGPITIDKNLTIDGAPPDTETVLQIGGPMPVGSVTFSILEDAAITVEQTARGANIFQVDGTDAHGNPVNVSLSRLTLTGADTVTGGYFGGAIDNAGHLSLDAMTVSGNSAGLGGGIYNIGLLQMTASTISGNSASLGGGIYNDSGGALIVTDSTLARNSASSGGAIYAVGSTVINHDTVAGNSASSQAGGIYSASGSMAIANTIVAANRLTTSQATDPDVYGTFALTDHDLIGDLGNAGDVTGFAGNGNMIAGTDDTGALGLGPLQNNGGHTETIALLPGSPAIDAGDNTPVLPFSIPATDQRGYARIANGTVDIGAYEVERTLYVAKSFIDQNANPISTPAAGELVNWPASGQFGEVDQLIFGTNAFTSIQAAVAAAAAGDTIDVAAGTYSEAVTINLPLTLEGACVGATTTIVDPNLHQDQGVMIFGSGNAVNLRGFTITGFATGVYLVSGSANLTQDTVSNNGFAGIGMSSDTSLTVADSTISGNSGGGIVNLGIQIVQPSATLRYLYPGVLHVSYCTISGNSSDFAGGIANVGVATVTGSTISGNTAASAGGIFSGTEFGGVTNVANTIVAGNTGSDPDVSGAFAATDHDLIGLVGDATGFTDGNGKAINGNLVGTTTAIDPKLGPLEDNGGPTQTMFPLPGSPAIDAGDNTPPAPFPPTPATDQRGLPRIANGTVDIGAYEVQPSVSNFSATVGGRYTVELVGPSGPAQRIEIFGPSGNVVAESFVAYAQSVSFTNASGQSVQVVVDSTSGAIPAPILFDGGAGTGSSLVLQGGTATSDTYSPGPNGGQGTDTLVIGGVTETVSFVNLTPVYDSVAGDLTVNGTNGNDAISYVEGNDTTGAANAAWGQVTVNNLEAINFTNKATLTIDTGAGTDTVDLNNPNMPMGLTNIDVNGSEPAGNVTLTAHTVPGAANALIVTPTGTGSGILANVYQPQPTVTFTDTSQLDVVARTVDMNQQLVYTGTSGNDTLELTPGATGDSGKVTGSESGSSGFGFVPLVFSGFNDTLGGQAVVDLGSAFGNGAAGGTDTAIIDGTSGDDTFTIESSPVYGNSNAVIESVAGAQHVEVAVDPTRGVSHVVLRSLGGNDVVNAVMPTVQPTISYSIEGNGPSGGTTTFNYAAPAGAASTVDLAAGTITATGANPISFSGLTSLKLDANGGAVTVIGDSQNDNFIYTPEAADEGLVQLASSATPLDVSDLQGAALTLRSNGSMQSVTVDETTDYDVYTSLGASTTVTVGSLLPATIEADVDTTLTLHSSTTNDDNQFIFSGGSGPAVQVAGGGLSEIVMPPQGGSYAIASEPTPRAGFVGTPDIHIYFTGVSEVILDGGGAAVQMRVQGGGFGLQSLGPDATGIEITGGFAIGLNNTGDGNNILVLLAEASGANYQIEPQSGWNFGSVQILDYGGGGNVSLQAGGFGGAEAFSYTSTGPQAAHVQLASGGATNTYSMSGVSNLNLAEVGTATASLAVTNANAVIIPDSLPGTGTVTMTDVSNTTALLPLTYTNIATVAASGTSAVIDAPDDGDTVTVSQAGVVTITNNVGVVNTIDASGYTSLAIDLLGADDTLTFQQGNSALWTGGVTVIGGTSDTVQVTGDGTAVTVSMDGTIPNQTTISGGGFASLAIDGLTNVHVDANGGAVNVVGTSLNNAFTYTPEAADEGLIQLASSSTLLDVSDLQGAALTIDPGSGATTVTVDDAAGGDDFHTALGAPTTTVAVGSLLSVSVVSADTGSLALHGTASGTFYFTGTGGPKIQIAGGNSTISLPPGRSPYEIIAGTAPQSGVINPAISFSGVGEIVVDGGGSAVAVQAIGGGFSVSSSGNSVRFTIDGAGAPELGVTVNDAGNGNNVLDLIAEDPGEDFHIQQTTPGWGDISLSGLGGKTVSLDAARTPGGVDAFAYTSGGPENAVVQLSTSATTNTYHLNGVATLNLAEVGTATASLTVTNSNAIITPSLTPGDGTVTMTDVNNMTALLPLTYTNIATVTASGTSAVIEAPDAGDKVAVSASGVVTITNKLGVQNTIDASGYTSLAVDLMGAGDTVAFQGDNPLLFSGGVTLVGGAGGYSVTAAIAGAGGLDLSSDSVAGIFGGSVTLDGAASLTLNGDGATTAMTVNNYGAPSTLAGVTLNADATIAVTTGGTGNTFDYTSLSPNSATLGLVSGGPTIEITGFNLNPGALSLASTGGVNTLAVIGSSSNDQFDVSQAGIGTRLRQTSGGAAWVPLDFAGFSSVAIDGAAGNDTLTVDSSAGAVTTPIVFDGGTGSNALSLIDTVNTATSDVYSPGPGAGEGTDTFNFGTAANPLLESVQFTNLTPVYDSVAGPVTVDGTSGNDAISYTEGNDTTGAATPTWGQVTVNNLEALNFTNKTSLTINTGLGTDAVSLNDPNGPTGLTGITVNGGDPAAGDTLLVNGTTSRDLIDFAPTSATAATITGAGPVTIGATGIGQTTINGQGGNDVLTVTSPRSSYFTFTPGQSADAGTVTAHVVPVGQLMPLAFSGLGNSGTLAFADVSGTPVDALDVDGTSSNNQFNLSPDGSLEILQPLSFLPITPHIETPGVALLRLIGGGGNDTFNLPGTYSGVAALGVQGDAAGKNTVDFEGDGTAPITVDLGLGTVVESGFTPVTFSSIAALNVDALGGPVTVLDANADTSLSVTPNGSESALVQAGGAGTLVQLTDVAGAVTVGLAGGGGTLSVDGATPSQTFTATNGSVTVNGDLPIDYTAAQLAQLDINGNGGGNRLVVDSATGAITVPIVYNGGNGSGSGNSLVLSGGAANGGDTYTPGPNAGQGTDTLNFGSLVNRVIETVQFSNLAPVYDSVGGPVTVNGTNGNDAISYTEGNDATGAANAAWGRVAVNNLEAFNFTNKTTLTIKTGLGADTVSSSNANTPAGLTGITINGGDPSAGDKLMVSGTTSRDSIDFAPTSATEAMLSGAGPVPINATGIGQTIVNGNGGNDELTVTAPSGGSEVSFTPDNNPDAGSVTMHSFPSRELMTITFSGLGNAGGLVFADASGQATDLVDIYGTNSANEFNVLPDGSLHVLDPTFFVPLTPTINTPGAAVLRLIGQGGNNVFNVPGTFSRTVVLDVQGSPAGSNTANFEGDGNAPLTVDLAAGTLVESGFTPVTVSGIGTLNLNALGAAVTAVDSSSNNTLNVTPTGTNTSTLQVAGQTQVVNTTSGGNLSVTLAANDALVVNGSQYDDTMNVSGTQVTDQETNGPGTTLQTVAFAGAASLAVNGNAGSDTFNVTPSAVPVSIDGGNPVGVQPGDTLNVAAGGGPAKFFAGPTTDAGGFVVGGNQPVSFTHIETLGSVAVTGTVLVQGTNANDDIQITATGHQSFTVSVNGGLSVPFAGVTTLYIDTLAGADQVNVTGPAAGSTYAWDENIFLAGASHAAGSNNVDSLTVETPRAGGLSYSPTGAESGSLVYDQGGGNTSTIAIGPFTIANFPAAPTTYTSSAGGVEQLAVNGEATGDALSVVTPAGPDAIVYTPGATIDAAAVAVGSLLPLSFTNLGPTASVSLADTSGTRADSLVYGGTPASDTFTVDAGTGTVHLNNQLALSTPGVANLTLNASTGNNTFNVSAASGKSQPFTSITLDGSASNADVLNLNGDGTAAVVFLSGSPSVTGGGLGAIHFSGVGTLNFNDATGAVTVDGTTANDTFNVIPTSANSATVQDNGILPLLYATTSGSLLFDGLGGNNTLVVNGSAAADTITAETNAAANPTVTVAQGAITDLPIAFVAGDLTALDISGLDGSDTLVVDSTHGPVTTPIVYDGGSGNNSLTLQGGTAVSDTYLPRPATGQGANLLDFGVAGKETVHFVNLSPVLDLVGGSLTVDGTSGDDAVNYTAGSVTANGKVTVNNLESIEFSNKTSLAIDSLAGSDTINLNNPHTPTGLASISVDGGDPTPGNDMLIVNGAVGAGPISYSPTATDGGSITGAGPAPVTLAHVERLNLNDQGLGDQITVNGTSSGNDTFVYTPGAAKDAATVAVNSLLALNYQNLGSGGALHINETSAGTSNTLLVNGAGTGDAFNVAANGTVTFDSRAPLSESGLQNLRLSGLGADSFALQAPLPYSNVAIDGGSSIDDNSLVLNGSAGPEAIVANLAHSSAVPPTPTTITGFGGTVSLSNIAQVNLNGNGGADTLTVNAVGDEPLNYQPTSASGGNFSQPGNNVAFSFNIGSLPSNVFTLNGAAQADVHGPDGGSAFIVDEPNRTVHVSNAAGVHLMPVVLGASVPAVELDAGLGKNSFLIAPAASNLLVDVVGGGAASQNGLTIGSYAPATGLPGGLALNLWAVQSATSNTAGSVQVFHSNGPQQVPDQYPVISYSDVASIDGALTATNATAGWVIGMYEMTLGRRPSAGEVSAWLTVISSGQLTQQQIALNFLESDERLSTIISTLYLQYLGRAADPSGIAYWTSVWRANHGEELVQAGIIASPEYYATAGKQYPTLSADAAWVTALYHNILGRAPDQDGINFWLSSLKVQTRSSIVLGFVTSDEYRLSTINEWFEQYLGRELDSSGAQYWLDQMKHGQGQDLIQSGIVSSQEFQTIFAGSLP